MSELLALEQRFSAAVRNRAVVARALPDFIGSAAQIESRLAIYRGNLVGAWQHALSNAYPVIRRVVGEDYFVALARQYGRAHPSQSGDLNQFGAGLAAFLADFVPARELPYLPSLARLEWLVHRSHYAADALPLTPAALAKRDVETLLALRLQLLPSASLFFSAAPAVSLWLAHRPGREEELGRVLEHRDEWALVHRRDFRVAVSPLKIAEARFLEACGRGAPVHEALGSALASDPDFDFGGTLARWLEERVFAIPVGEST